MSLAPPGANAPRAAFTLLELLAVVTIIALLAGILLGVGRHAAESGRTARARTELVAVSVALETYRQVYGDYPHTDDGTRLLRALLGRRGPVSDAAITGRAFLDAARFTVVDEALLDPWERPYVYIYKVPAGGWSNPRFVLYSCGPDQSDFRRLTTGGFADATAAGNADNIHANP